MGTIEPIIPDTNKTIIKHQLIEAKDAEGQGLVKRKEIIITNPMPWKAFSSRREIERLQIGSKKSR